MNRLRFICPLHVNYDSDNMITQLIGGILVADGLGSITEYKTQRVIQQKNGRLISCHYLYKLFHKRLPKGKLKRIKQSYIEHIPRVARLGIGFALVCAGLGLIVIPL